MHSLSFYHRDDDIERQNPLDPARTDYLDETRNPFVPDFERLGKAVQLSPAEAVRKRILFDFWIYEEDALHFAIRKDPGIDLAERDIDALINLYLDRVIGEDESLYADDPDLDEIVEEILEILREATRRVASGDGPRRNRRR